MEGGQNGYRESEGTKFQLKVDKSWGCDVPCETIVSNTIFYICKSLREQICKSFYH